MLENSPNYSIPLPNKTDEETDVADSLAAGLTIIDTEIKNRKDELDSHKTVPDAHDSANIKHGDGNVRDALFEVNSRLTANETDIEEVDSRISSIVAQAGNDNTEIVDARGGFVVLHERLENFDSSLADNAISPESYSGNAMEKISAAIQEAITQNKSVKFSKIYDITGLGTIVIDKPATNRQLLHLIGVGGGIKKTDAGSIFTTALLDQGDIISHSMKYIGTSGVGTSVWDGNKMIRIGSHADSYISIDKVIEADNRWLQSIRLKNCTIIDGAGFAVSARHMFDCSFSENTVELRESFIRNSYDVPPTFGQENFNLRIENNVIEGLTGKAISLGACKGSKIKGNYLELNDGGYIDLSTNPNTVSHGGLEVSNNSFDLSTTQVANNTPSIKWGFLNTDVTSIGNVSNGLLHSITVNGQGNVNSIGENYGTLTDSPNRVSILKGIDKNEYILTSLPNGEVRKWGALIKQLSNPVTTASVPANGETIINIPLPQQVISPADITLQVIGQWAQNTWQIISWSYGGGFGSIDVKIKNLHTSASTFIIYAVASHFSY